MNRPRVQTYLISLGTPGAVHHHGDLTVAHVKILRPFCHSRIHRSVARVTETHEAVRVFAFASAEMQPELRRQLAPIGVTPVFIERAAELSYITRDRAFFHVALLPAALPDSDWWALWGSISLLNPRPAILVYAQTADFQLWSGVLEAGGYDVIVEPFTDQEIQRAVTRAAASFEERRQNELGNE